MSDNGQTDCQITIRQLEHFELHTLKQTIRLYYLLVLNSHISHVLLKFIQFYNTHNIIILCLPPYLTHILQLLNISIFRLLALAYKQLIQQHSMFSAENILKEDFLHFFQLVRQDIITPCNIQSAQKAASLLPFNPSPILTLL